MVRKNYVYVVLLGRIEKWESRQRAIDFYTEGMLACDPGSSESERYATVVMNLYAGEHLCTDGSEWNGTYATFNNPENSRDYNGKIWFPVKSK